MTRRRGFTLLEMMLAVSIMAILIGGVTAVYAYTMVRLGYSLASYTTQREGEYGLDVIDHIIGESQTCSQISVGGNPCLKCILPASCVDPIGDGTSYVCSPDTINRRSLERWGNGKRIWFYLANSGGVPTTPGSILWMACRTDDSTPTATDIVNAYTYYPGNTKLRVDLIQALTTMAGANANLDQVTVTVGSYTGQDAAAPSSASLTNTYQPALSRTPYERGWRF